MAANVDLLIVGAGPAGVAAAITAIKAGRSVIMFAGRRKGWYSCEGVVESVEPIVEYVLSDLGIQDAVSSCSRGEYQGVMTNGIFIPVKSNNGKYERGHHILKEEFNSYLVAHAVKCGVKVIYDTNVVSLSYEMTSVTALTSDGDKYTGRYVVVATGRARPPLQQQHIFSTKYSMPITAWSGLAENIPPKEWNLIETSFISSKTGWVWLAPHSNNKCTWTMLARTKGNLLVPPAALKEYYNPLQVRVANVRWSLQNSVAYSRTLLAGDIAGNIDPAAGRGILAALWSGKIAAETILYVLHHEMSELIAFGKYEKWFRVQHLGIMEQLAHIYQQLGIFQNQFFQPLGVSRAI